MNILCRNRIASLCLMFLIISLGPSKVSLGQTPEAPSEPALKHYELQRSLDLSSMDRTANPCEDFYQFSCGNFAATHPIPSSDEGVDQYRNLSNVIQGRLAGILAAARNDQKPRSRNQQLIGDYYQACTDIDRSQKDGFRELTTELNAISTVHKAHLLRTAGELQRIGVTAFLDFGVSPDPADSNAPLFHIGQGGLGMPANFYLGSDERSRHIREAYEQHVTRMLELAGETDDRAIKNSAGILKFETRMARQWLPEEVMRDAKQTYHPQTLQIFLQSSGPLGFGQFLKALHAPSLQRLNSLNPSYLNELRVAVAQESIETLRAYLVYRLLYSFAGDLPKRFRTENFAFYSKELAGVAQPGPRDRRCEQLVQWNLGDALGQLYVDQFFPSGTRAKATGIIDDVENQLDQQIKGSTWLGATTKVEAEEKLRRITLKVGYPDKWKDYSRVAVTRDDSLRNDMQVNAFEVAEQLRMLARPVDRSTWILPPTVVDAYYDPSQNSINFTAGFLNPPFFDPVADLAVQYGHLGVTAGHELSHAFDDNGRTFDGQGNLRDWWAPSDLAFYTERSKCFEDQYGGFTSDGVSLNGKLELGENLADNGGLSVAYLAYISRSQALGIDPTHQIDGLTGPQRLFVANAQVSCENQRPTFAKQQMLTEPHAPGRFRVNGTVQNIRAFGEAFSCAQGQPMMPPNVCRIW